MSDRSLHILHRFLECVIWGLGFLLFVLFSGGRLHAQSVIINTPIQTLPYNPTRAMLTLQLAPGATDDLLDGKDSTGAIIFSVDSGGNLTVSSCAGCNVGIFDTIQLSLAESGTATGSVTYQSGIDGTSTSSAAAAVFRAADNSTSSGAATAGPASLRGGNCTSTTCTAGNVQVFGGRAGAATTGALHGLLQIGEYYRPASSGAVANAYDIVGTSGSLQVTDCATTPCTNIVGIAQNTSSGTSQILVLSYGQSLVNSSAATVGHHICAGTSSAGVGADQAGACTIGTEIGVVVSVTEQGSSSTLPLVQLRI
jgi:hypothetical protein